MALGLAAAEGARAATAPWWGGAEGGGGTAGGDGRPGAGPLRALGRVRGVLPGGEGFLLGVLPRGRAAAAGGDGAGTLLLVETAHGPAGAALLPRLALGDWCVVLGDAVGEEAPDWSRVPRSLRRELQAGEGAPGKRAPARVVALALRNANGCDAGLYGRAAACARRYRQDLAERGPGPAWAAWAPDGAPPKHHVLTTAAEVRAAVAGRDAGPAKEPFLVELVGTVADESVKERFRAWSLDDGLGLVLCILWKQSAPGCSLEAVRLTTGDVVRVRGKVSVYHGYPQVEVSQLFQETPLTETLAEARHWARVALARGAARGDRGDRRGGERLEGNGGEEAPPRLPARGGGI